MKRTARVRRDMIRERRRWGAGRTVYDLRAGMKHPDAKLALDGLRLRLLLQRFTMGDGIAYIPYDALGEHAPAPRSGGVPHTATVGPQGHGKTILPDPSLPWATAPINAAYWIGGETEPATSTEHTYNGECPTCGECAAVAGETELVNGVPESCGCCLCDQEDAEQDYEEMGADW